MVSIKEDCFDLILLAPPKVSPTGRFVFFLGTHYNGKQTCYDVGVVCMHLKGKPTTRRHHYTKEEALVTWSEVTTKLSDIESMKEENDEPINLETW